LADLTPHPAKANVLISLMDERPYTQSLMLRLFADVGVAGRKLLRATIDGIYPPSCTGCGRQTAEPGALCGFCWNSIKFIEKPFCAIYGTPFSTELGDGMISARAIADPPPYARSRAAVAYQGLALRFVHGLKFQDRQDHARWMAKWMARAAPDLISDADVILPVPLHWQRMVSRRFNQSALLAQKLAQSADKPFAPLALKRIKATVTQRGLTAKERDANVKRAFIVPENQSIHVQGRRVLLIDDVITTGSTVAAATKALLRAGASEVDVLAFAMVLKQES
jgi:ComF family protein